MFVLDSCICIEFMRGKLPYAYKYLQECDPQLVKVPAVVKGELLLGARRSGNPLRNWELTETFLSPFELLPFDAKCAYVYAEIRDELQSKGKLIGYNDMLIAAVARANNGILVTRNEHEFARIKDLPIEVWDEMEFDFGSGA